METAPKYGRLLRLKRGDKEAIGYWSSVSTLNPPGILSTVHEAPLPPRCGASLCAPEVNKELSTRWYVGERFAGPHRQLSARVAVKFTNGKRPRGEAALNCYTYVTLHANCLNNKVTLRLTRFSRLPPKF